MMLYFFPTFLDIVSDFGGEEVADLLLIDIEHHLHVPVNLAGYGEALTIDALLQLCALYEHELASYILLVVNGCLDIFLFHSSSA